MNIHGRKVVLRAPELRDVELLNRWSNDPEIWNGLGGWHFPFSTLSTEAWVKGADNGSLRGHVFMIDEPELGLIGTANLVNIDWKNRNALHGMMLGDKETRGKGYGTDTVMAIMRYAFDYLGLERLDTDIIEYNEASLKLYLGRCGWVEEGRLRRWHYRNGRFYDKIVIGVTRSDYDALIQRTRYWGEPA